MKSKKAIIEKIGCLKELVKKCKTPLDNLSKINLYLIKQGVNPAGCTTAGTERKDKYGNIVLTSFLGYPKKISDRTEEDNVNVGRKAPVCRQVHIIFFLPNLRVLKGQRNDE